MILTLTPETEARLRDRAAREGQDVSEYAEAVFNDHFEDDPDALTPEQVSDIRRGIQRGLDAIERGKWRSLDSFAAEVSEQQITRTRL